MTAFLQELIINYLYLLTIKKKGFSFNKFYYLMQARSMHTFLKFYAANTRAKLPQFYDALTP